MPRGKWGANSVIVAYLLKESSHKVRLFCFFLSIMRGYRSGVGVTDAEQGVGATDAKQRRYHLLGSPPPSLCDTPSKEGDMEIPLIWCEAKLI